MTKMEALRKIIEELKGLDKDDIQSLVNEMMKKDDEEDEDVGVNTVFHVCDCLAS